MPFDLKSKLEMYKNGRPDKPVHPKESGRDIHDLLQGTECVNYDGAFFMIENRYPLTYLHGGCSLGDCLEIDGRTLALMAPDSGGEPRVSDFLFLDTETTGLSGGTGTVAFLAGAGFFEADSFVLRQYFMRDYDEEPAMLRALCELFSRFAGLVSFNGKAFDWNLLQNRFIFNRIKPEFKSPVHIDLLFPARRIWKLKLESCRLVSLEENILGEFRVDDIPGALIPSVYFKYLEDRDATVIKKVIRHNEADILSMVSLLVKICGMLKNPLSETDGGHELMGVGKILEDRGEYDITVGCYENCLKSDSYFVKDKAARRLSDIYKRSGDYPKAVEHWLRQTECSLREDRSPDHSLPQMQTQIFCLIELAKYYEHREKNPAKALEAVEKGNAH